MLINNLKIVELLFSVFEKQTTDLSRNVPAHRQSRAFLTKSYRKLVMGTCFLYISKRSEFLIDVN